MGASPKLTLSIGITLDEADPDDLVAASLGVVAFVWVRDHVAIIPVLIDRQ